MTDDFPRDDSSEERLRDREAERRAILSAMAEGVILVDASGRVRECNEAAERILGVTRDQVIGRMSVGDPALEVVKENGSPCPPAELPVMVALTSGRAVSNVVLGLGPAGRRTWLLVSAQPLCHDGEEAPYAAVATFTDLTDRVLLNQELGRTARQLEAVLAGSNDGFWDWDIATGRVHFSDRWAAILGYQPAEVDPHVGSWERLVHPDDLPTVRSALEGHLRGDTALYECEHRLRHKQGHWVWVLDRGKVVERDRDGRPTRAAGTHTDITARKQAEAAAQLERRRLFDLFEALPVYVYLQAPDYSIRFANAYFRRQFGDPRGRQCYRCLWEREAPCEACPTFRVFDDAQPQQWEWHHAPDGRSYEVLDYPFTDTDGSLLVLELGIDITERKRAEAELRDRESQLAAYFQSPAVGVAIVDADGRWRRVNDRLCAMLGYTREELLQQTFLDTTHPEDREVHLEPMAKLMAGETDTFAVDKRYLRKDGTTLWALLSVSALRDAAGHLTARIAIVTDITERKRAEDDNRRLIADLRSALDEVKTLSGMLPICMYCKKIRDDRGFWERIETYIAQHTDARFSHGMCPDCVERVLEEEGLAG